MAIIPYFHPHAVGALKEFILKNGKPSKLKKGQFYKHPDEQLTHLALIENGLCYYMYIGEERSDIVAVCLPDTVMGDATFLAPMNVPFHIMAKRDTKLIVVPLVEVEKFCRQTRDVFEAVVTSSMLKFQSYVEGMLLNFTQNPEKRMCFLVKSIIAFTDVPESEWMPLKLRLTHEEFGEIVHSSRITVNRILNQWKSSGLLKRDAGVTYINKKILSYAIF